MRVTRLTEEDVALIAAIDRTEHVELQYRVVDGRLEQQPVPRSMADIAPWDPTGSGPHSVAGHIESCGAVLSRGGVLLGAFDGEDVAGLAVVVPTFESDLAWLAFLHVSRPHRRKGAATALWAAAAEIATEAGDHSMYVSASNTESAVGFYLRQGCRLARPVHPDLFAQEPEDIHLICPLT